VIATLAILILFWMIAYPVAQDWRHPIHWIFLPYTFLVLLNLTFGGFKEVDTRLGLLVYAAFFGMMVFGLWVTELSRKGVFGGSTRITERVAIRQYQSTRFFQVLVGVLIGLLASYYISNIISDPLTYFVNIRHRIMISEFSYPFFFMLISPISYVYLSSVNATELKSTKVLVLVLVLLILFDLAKTDRSTLKPLSMFLITFIVVRGFRLRQMYTPLLIFSALMVAIGVIRHEPTDSETTFLSSVLWHFYVDTAGNMSSYFNAINNPFDCGSSMVFPITSVLGAETCSREVFYTDIGYFFNTYPAPAYLYSAWGIFGILVCGFVIGLMNGVAYRFLFRSIAGVSFYGLIVMSNIWMFRGVTFGATGFLLALLLTAIAQKFVWKKTIIEENSNIPSVSHSKKNHLYDEAFR
jgi:oligosaccharide repeat unit polymerase